MGDVHDLFTGERLLAGAVPAPVSIYESQVEAKVVGDIESTTGIGSPQADIATARKIAQLFATHRDSQSPDLSATT